MRSYKGLIATTLALVGLTGCSLRYADVQECTSDEDCRRFEAADGVFYTCSESNTCVESSDVECRADADCDGDQTCSASNTCEGGDVDVDMGTDTGGEVDMGTDMGEPGCSSNQQCIDERGTTYACGADGECFDLLGANGECERVHYTQPANEVENVVYFGTMLPLVEPFGTVIGRPIENAVQLAVDAFNKAGGLPGGRKIAWISCDSKGNPAIARAAATHLVDTVGVPATLGPLFSEPFLDVVSSVTNPKDVLAFQPTGTSPQINSLFEPKKLVWRNIASDVFQGYAATRWIQDTGLTRVLVLYKDDLYGNDLRQEIAAPLVGDLGASNVKFVPYTNPVVAEDPTTAGLLQEYGATILGAMRPDQQDMAQNFDPQLVFIIGTSEGALAASSYLTVSTQLSTPPGKVLFSHGVVPSLAELSEQLEQLGQAGAVGLFDGVAPDIFDPTSSTYRSYAIAYNTTFGGTQPALASTTTFDGVLSIFFAMSAVPDGTELSGPEIASQFGRLANTEGEPVTFYETNYIGKARSALAAGNDVDLTGVSGPLDYDPTTGEVYTRFINWKPIKDDVAGWTITPAQIMAFPNAPETTGATWVGIPQPD